MKGVQDSMKQAGDTMKEATEQTKGIGGALKDIGSKAGSAIGTVGKLAGAFGLFKATSAIMGMVKDSIGAAFDRQDTMDQFDKTMKIMGVSTKDTEKALESLKGVTKGTAYGLDVAAKATQNFVTRGMDIGGAAKSVGIWSDAVAVYGKGTNEQLESVTTAIGKMRTKGTVEMDNLNTLFDAGIDAVGMYAQAHGQSASEVQSALSSGAISTEDFLKTVEEGMATGEGGIRKIAGSAKEMGGSWAGSFANMKAATVRGMLEIINSIDEGLAKINLPSMKEMLSGFGQFMETTMAGIGSGISSAFELIGGVFSKFEPQIKAVSEWFTETWTNIQTNAMPIIAEIFEGISEAFSVMIEYVTQLFTGENSIANSFMTAFGSIGEVAIPILQDAFTFIGELFDTLVQWWKENGEAIAESVKTVWATVSETISTVMNFLAPFIEGTWANIKTYIKAALDIILAVVKVVLGLLSGDWKMVMEGLQSIASTVWNTIKELISNAVTTMKEVVTSIWDGIKSKLSETWNNIKSTASDTWDGIKSAIVKPIEKAKEVISGIIDKIKGLFDFKLKFPEVSIPHIPMPKFSKTGKFSLSPLEVPNIGLTWHESGGIVKGTKGGTILGMGENHGDEAIVPLSNKGRMKPFAQAISSMLDIPSESNGTGLGTSRVIIEVPVSLDSREIAKAVATDVDRIVQQAQERENRKRGSI